MTTKDQEYRKKYREKAKKRLHELEAEIERWTWENNPVDDDGNYIWDDEWLSHEDRPGWWDPHNELLAICRRFSFSSEYNDEEWDPEGEWSRQSYELQQERAAEAEQQRRESELVTMREDARAISSLIRGIEEKIRERHRSTA